MFLRIPRYLDILALGAGFDAKIQDVLGYLRLPLLAARQERQEFNGIYGIYGIYECFETLRVSYFPGWHSKHVQLRTSIAAVLEDEDVQVSVQTNEPWIFNGPSQIDWSLLHDANICKLFDVSCCCCCC